MPPAFGRGVILPTLDTGVSGKVVLRWEQPNRRVHKLLNLGLFIWAYFCDIDFGDMFGDLKSVPFGGSPRQVSVNSPLAFREEAALLRSGGVRRRGDLWKPSRLPIDILLSPKSARAAVFISCRGSFMQYL